MPLADHLAQPVRLAQPGGGTEDMAHRDRAAEHRGGILAHGVLTPVTTDQSSGGVPDMTSRTSIHSYRGSPPGPGSEET